MSNSVSDFSFACDVDADLNLLQVSGETSALLGFSTSEMVERKNYLHRCGHQDDLQALQALCETLPNSDTPSLHMRLRGKDKQFRIFWVSVTAYLQPDVISLSFVDVRHLPHAMTGLDSDIVTVLMETTNDFIFFKDAHHVLLAASQSMVSLCEPISHWREFSGKIDYEVFPESLVENYYNLEVQVYAGESVAQGIQPIIRPDGTQGWVDNRKYPVKNDAGEIIGLYGIARDVTAQVKALREQRLAASVFEHTSESIVIVDAQANVLNANPVFAKTTGREVNEVVGKNLKEVRHGSDGDEAFRRRWQRITDKGRWQGELSVQLPNGQIKTEMARYNVVKDEHGKDMWYVGIYTDITTIKNQAKALEYSASHDQLTGLPNRTLLAERLAEALARAKRHESEVVVAFIDLDSFKLVNDELGHHEGDQFLVETGKAMRACLREVDTLARVGGDEFVAVLTDVSGLDEYGPFLERILEALESVSDSTGRFTCTASIGVASYPMDGTTAEELIRRADQAMYSVKQSGKGAFKAYKAI
ncbi:sensor domain-containing diguanylate cyclase [Alteromonas sediminis]|uniref:Sensor domain-containing diguanylate cyclase n=1 Tax=Alteromonas sediminis TaxID=2259342 RepID=A0A3N5YQM0_9ALTE|nr:sensor domain-containing diguanylate cyclase [Alteromonas sediminis]RPJ68491.1 sensor domain-containing diguanylate cyclase [Alteromonas sediminis]